MFHSTTFLPFSWYWQTATLLITSISPLPGPEGWRQWPCWGLPPLLRGQRSGRCRCQRWPGSLPCRTMQSYQRTHCKTVIPNEGDWCTLKRQVRSETQRANAQMIHIHCAFKASLQSFSLHNQPSWKFGLLHTTLQQNVWTDFSFLITLWPYTKVKVIQDGIKL